MNCLVCGKELTGKQTKYCSRYCSKLGEKRRKRGHAENVRPRRSHLPWTDEDVQNRINTKSSKIIYLGGYEHCESTLYLQCSDCGYLFTRTARTLRKRSPIQCDNCRQIVLEIESKEHHEKVLLDREKRKEETRERNKRECLLNHTKVCPRCGKIFIAPRKNRLYCSIRCGNRQREADKNHLRRMRIQGQKHDSITLYRLAERDRNRCWLCKKQVDWNDYKVTEEGHFIASKNYPSIDHVIALSNGGSHTWDNVRLAHKGCNTKKSDKLFTEKENGQIILFC